jgi:hypothetical protein
MMTEGAKGNDRLLPLSLMIPFVVVEAVWVGMGELVVGSVVVVVVEVEVGVVICLVVLGEVLVILVKKELIVKFKKVVYGSNLAN